MRTEHKSLHKRIIDMGYNMYMVDYKQGGHVYQFDNADGEWHDYEVLTKKKIIRLNTCEGKIAEMVREHYTKQGYTIED